MGVRLRAVPIGTSLYTAKQSGPQQHTDCILNHAYNPKYVFLLQALAKSSRHTKTTLGGTHRSFKLLRGYGQAHGLVASRPYTASGERLLAVIMRHTADS